MKSSIRVAPVFIDKAKAINERCGFKYLSKSFIVPPLLCHTRGTAIKIHNTVILPLFDIYVNERIKNTLPNFSLGVFFVLYIILLFSVLFLFCRQNVFRLFLKDQLNILEDHISRFGIKSVPRLADLLFVGVEICKSFCVGGR